MMPLSELCRSCGGPLVPIRHVGIGRMRKNRFYLDVVRCDSCGWLWWANAARNGREHRCLLTPGAKAGAAS